MAKFLPFVVEKSTPLYIYQTLISRSKGMNEVLIASLFYLVVEHGIEVVRKKAAELPEMDLGKVYEALLASFPSNRISNDYFKKIQLVGAFVKVSAYDRVPVELKEYSIRDIMSFFLVMHLLDRLDEYTELKFKLLFNGESLELENKLIEHNLFSADGEEHYFSTREDIAAYVHFYAGIMIDKKMPSVKAVFKPVDTREHQWADGEEPYDPAKYSKADYDAQYKQDPRKAPDFDADPAPRSKF